MPGQGGNFGKGETFEKVRTNERKGKKCRGPNSKDRG